MNNPVPPGRWFLTRRSLTSAGLLVVALLSAIFWLVTTPLAFAGQATCQVCHRRTTTVTLPCDSLEYRRHLDHGDAMGACMITPIANQ